MKTKGALTLKIEHASDQSLDGRPEILIVDDDNAVILALHNVLSPIGRTRFASSAAQALAMMEEALPTLILLDVEMPDMSGLELCAKLKNNAETSNIPVLFITSHIEQGFEEHVFDAGAADYIMKPLKPRVVAARVQTHLAYHNAIKMLAAQAYTDGLTGINNRRHFDRQLSVEFKRALRQQSPLTVMMIDVDEFKKFNDHFGHLDGDTCLKAVASTLRKELKRPGDFVARYGGEEFSLILPDTNAKGAELLANALLNAVRCLQLEQAPSATYPCVTVSIGYSTLNVPTDDTNTVTNTALLQLADRALYQAKEQGRDRCCYEKLIEANELDRVTP